MPSGKTIDVLGLGAVAVDDFIFVEAYPPADSKARVLRRERHCGGLAATALVAAARLGGRCAYAGVLGKDELSEFALNCLKAEGIDIRHAQRTDAARPVYSNIVVDERRGTRNVFFDVEKVIGAGLHTPASLIASSRVLFADNLGVRGTLRAARLARRAGIPVVADFDNDQHPLFGELLALTDHLILSQDFAAVLTGTRVPQKALRKLATDDRQVVVVTVGAAGCWYWAKGCNAPTHQPAFKVKVVDTTGCGDVFHGAYAFGLARNLPVAEGIRLAAATAALKATRPGGQAGIPSFAAVQKLLKQ